MIKEEYGYYEDLKEYSNEAIVKRIQETDDPRL
jgi:hypothetical protein